MYKSVLYILHIKFADRGPQIPFLVKIRLELVVDDSDQRITPDIKLSISVEHRLVNVLLHDIGALIGAHCFSVFYAPRHLVDGGAHRDAYASIRGFPWLHDPAVVEEPVVRQFFLEVSEVFYEVFEVAVPDPIDYVE